MLAVPALSGAVAAPDPTVKPKRDTEPVVLRGAALGDWSVPSNVTAKLPATDLMEAGQCALDESTCDTHNNYAEPEVDSSQTVAPEGTPIDRLLAYRWSPAKREFVQIPFQVDEVFTRYLDNSASGFAFYSGQDQHTSYAFDREGFRFTESDPENPCLARPADGRETTPDPVKGLDHNDELVFMADDGGPQAPRTTPLPRGIESARRVDLIDPLDPLADRRFVYLMRARASGPRPAFDASNGYVSYTRDDNADIFEKSESSYENYGNARRGVVCNEDGEVVAEDERRRPRDYATVETDRYRFRYDGRWLMTDVRISPDGGETFGPDLVDRWKARAFQQDPSSETPCCGYEEEDTNWGGSSTLLGERVGPVRAIRETWGADSGTNVIRRETFYRREVRQKSWLRVHVIPPLDGIYAQWDFNAGVVRKFFNSANPNREFRIDGRNDEVYGNFDDPCNSLYDGNERSDLDTAYREVYASSPLLCDPEAFEYHQSIDLPDITRSEFNAAMQWNLVTGPDGSIVDRYQVDELTDLTPGGAVQSLMAVPYYRDDSCFDDGTGTDPGPRIELRASDEPRTTADGEPRRCWRSSDGVPDGSDRFFQGSIATHGLHILAIADSDNARTTIPLTEIVAEQRMVMLPGWKGWRRGEMYGRGFERSYRRLIVTPPNPARTGSAPAPEPEPEPDPGSGEPAPEPAPAQGAPGAPAPSQPGTDTTTRPPARQEAPPTATTRAPRARIPAQRVRATRSGRAKVRVRCVGEAGTRCRDRLVLRMRRGERRVRAGARRFRITAGTTKTVRVKLSRRARARLARRGKLRVRAQVAGRGRKLTLRRR